MRAALLVALALLGAAPAWAAEEPSGCDKFKWNIDHERAALTAPDLASDWPCSGVSRTSTGGPSSSSSIEVTAQVLRVP